MSLASWLRTLKTRLDRSYGRRPSRPRRRRVALTLDALEERPLLSTFAVTNTFDDGSVGSLRWAINQVNADTADTAAQPDTIAFAIPTTDPGYHAPAASVGVTSVSLSANVATLTTSATLPFAVGQTVTVAGLSNSFLDGNYQVTAVTATSFSYALAHADLASTADAGTASDPSWFTIAPSAALPTVTDTLVLDGYTQPGASANSLAVGDNAVLKIVLDGSNISAQDDALAIAAGNSIVQGLVVQNFSNDIHLTMNGNDVIAGNYLTITNNLVAAPNFTGTTGVFVDGVPNNTIGGTSARTRNVIASQTGVVIQGAGATGNQVQGDYIGTDGSQLLTPAFIGILVADGADNNIVGGTATGAGNVISPLGWGVWFGLLGSLPVSGNLVQGNYIGTDATGNALPAGLPTGHPFGPDKRFEGIAISSSSSENTIGGTTASARNVITGWGDQVLVGNPAGVPPPTGNVVAGNYIGTNAAGSSALPHPDDKATAIGVAAGLGNTTISDNLISGLGGAGVVVGGSGDQVQGNLIGTDATGTQAIPNGIGVSAGSNAQIGGTAPGEGNIVAFNDGPAVYVTGTGDAIEGNSIYGNNDINGHTGQPIDNLNQDRDSLTTLPELNWPGGPFSGTDNSYVSSMTLTQTGSTLYYSGTLYGLANTRYLVELWANSSDGNYWGSDYVYLTTDSSGQLTFTNISFPAPWGLSNTPGTPAASTFVAHSLGNYEQNYPVLTSASISAGGTTVSGTLNGQANTTFRVEFFANAAPDATGYGQGQTYLGYANVTTDASGNATFTASGLAALPGGEDYLSATATDPNGNTSQFCQDLDLLLTTPTVTQSGGSTTVGFTLRNVSNESYTVNWGDGSGPQTIPAGQSSVSHVYSAAGIYDVEATAANQAAAPPATATVIIGTTAGDQISASGGTTAGQVVLSETSTNQSQTQAPSNMLVVSGDGGSDTYTVNFGSTLTTPIYLFGGGSASGDTLVANGDNSSTNVFTKTPGQITWGNPVTETLYRSGIPNTTINANGTSQNYVNDPGGNTVINGGPGTNTISITASTGNGVVINGGPHANNYVITMGSLLGPVTINSTAGTSTVTVYGPPGSNVLTLTPTQLTGAGQTINLNLGTTATSLTVDGSAGNDQLVVQGTPPGPLAADHLAPTVGAITAPSAPVALSTAVSVSAPFTELDGSSVTAVWAWGDGSTTGGSVTQTGTSGTVGGSHAYAADGVYTVTLTLTNPSLETGQSVFQYVVVYNPNAGFVTGGGWFTSPAGALAASPGLTGRANFGLNAKYKSGATVPTGNTEFQFPAGNLTFHATSYDWLVITTNQAQYQGSGTINGAGTYGFQVTAQDNGGTTPDLLRLTIWDKNNNNAVVYDTQPGAPTTAAPTTALGGGRIQVHTNAQLVAGGPNPGGGNPDPLTPDELRPVVQEAIARWGAAGIAPSQVSALSQVAVGIADFPGPWLGMAFPGAVWIAQDAAGYGWSVDATAGGAAPGRVDLLTVVEHELGHELGLGDNTGTGLMGLYLAPGVRRDPAPDQPAELAAGPVPGTLAAPPAPAPADPGSPTVALSPPPWQGAMIFTTTAEVGRAPRPEARSSVLLLPIPPGNGPAVTDRQGDLRTPAAVSPEEVTAAAPGTLPPTHPPAGVVPPGADQGSEPPLAGTTVPGNDSERDAVILPATPAPADPALPDDREPAVTPGDAPIAVPGGQGEPSAAARDAVFQSMAAAGHGSIRHEAAVPDGDSGVGALAGVVGENWVGKGALLFALLGTLPAARDEEPKSRKTKRPGRG
jgi:hypothetical protein